MSLLDLKDDLRELQREVMQLGEQVANIPVRWADGFLETSAKPVRRFILLGVLSPAGTSALAEEIDETSTPTGTTFTVNDPTAQFYGWPSTTDPRSNVHGAYVGTAVNINDNWFIINMESLARWIWVRLDEDMDIGQATSNFRPGGDPTSWGAPPNDRVPHSENADWDITVYDTYGLATGAVANDDILCRLNDRNLKYEAMTGATGEPPLQFAKITGSQGVAVTMAVENVYPAKLITYVDPSDDTGSTIEGDDVLLAPLDNPRTEGGSTGVYGGQILTVKPTGFDDGGDPAKMVYQIVEMPSVSVMGTLDGAITTATSQASVVPTRWVGCNENPAGTGMGATITAENPADAVNGSNMFDGADNAYCKATLYHDGWYLDFVQCP